MKKIILVLSLLLLVNETEASTKEKIIKNLENIKNFSFNFEQNINGKIENGNCIIEYPKKIFCRYELNNEKILVSNGKFLVIKKNTGYYIYPLKKTPLDMILDKNFLLKKIKKSKTRKVEEKFINIKFQENENEINLFFDKKTSNLIGWQTVDIYQNLNITYLSSINKNQILEKNLFNLPKQD